jgi:cell division transport system ATP-binding protein
VIRFLKVTHKHRDDRGIEDVSFSLERGEFALLAGPTGAGKTTILRLIYLELQPQSGQIMIEGQFCHSSRPREVARMRRKMGIVFPESRLLSDRTIFDNVALPLRIAGESSRRVCLLTNRMLYRFGLHERARSRPGELSSGEQKKAALARALVVRPFILLADEPLTNIDAETGAEIVDLLRQVNAEGTTILAATHLPQAFAGVARRTLQLKDGRLIGAGGAIP